MERIAADLDPLAGGPIDRDALAAELHTLLRSWAYYRVAPLLIQMHAEELNITAAAANPARKAMDAIAAVNWYRIAAFIDGDWSSADPETRQMVAALRDAWGPAGQRKLVAILGGIAAVAERAAVTDPPSVRSPVTGETDVKRPDLQVLAHGLAMIFWEHTTIRPTEAPVRALIDALVAAGVVPSDDVYPGPIRQAVELCQRHLDLSDGKSSVILNAERFVR